MSRHGLIGSLTIACSAMLVMGTRNPAFAANTLVCPATQMQTFSAAMEPRLVVTPATRPSAMSKPVTSHCWTMVTPSAFAARA